MRIAFFYPSLIEKSECGTSHFIHHICTQLANDGDEVLLFNPKISPSNTHQAPPPEAFYLNHPRIQIHSYTPEDELERGHLQKLLSTTDLALIYERCSPLVIHTLGRYKKENPHLKLLFHDHLHRIFSDPAWILDLDLQHYDGILTSRPETQKMYLSTGLTHRSWVWPEAINTSFFKPIKDQKKTIETVHTGIKTQEDYESPEFQECILAAIKELNVGIKLYGSYCPKPPSVQAYKSNITFRGKTQYTRMPEIYAQSRVAFYSPRTFLSRSSPHAPSMRILEALSCGVPLISTAWDDPDHLFTPGRDYLITHHPDETKELLKLLLSDVGFREELTHHARQSILNRFNSAQRATELKAIHSSLMS